MNKDENVMLDKIECIRWAKSNGYNLPDWCWELLQEHDDKLAHEKKSPNN